MYCHPERSQSEVPARMIRSDGKDLIVNGIPTVPNEILRRLWPPQDDNYSTIPRISSCETILYSSLSSSTLSPPQLLRMT